LGARLVGGHRRVGRRHWRDEDGTVLVLFALLLGLMLMVGALAVDVGYWWVNGKKAQIAADACALAAAQELPHTYADLPNCAIAAGQADYVLTHLPDQTDPDADPKHVFTRVRSPYHEDARMVEATVQIRVGTFFGRIFGVEEVIVERRAVAEREEGTSKMAIFTGSTDCSKGFLVNGKNVNVTGHIHSNGQYEINSAAPPDDFTATSGTIAKAVDPDGGNCTAKLNPTGPPSEDAGAHYGGEDWLPEDGPELQWPDWFSPADFGWYLPVGSGPGRCTYKGDRIEFNNTHLLIDGVIVVAHGKRIPTGTYCATNEFIINADDMCMPATEPPCAFTALAPKIEVGGNGQNYSPYAYDMLFFTVPNSNADPGDDGPFTLGNFEPKDKPPYPPCYPSPAIETNLDGSNYQWAGIIFNPCGRVKINNHDSSVGSYDLVGTIYGFEVEINGDGFNMIGTEDQESNISLALVE
jgi:uncharacterized Zn-binding protein involved in type VI secretion